MIVELEPADRGPYAGPTMYYYACLKCGWDSPLKRSRHAASVSGMRHLAAKRAAEKAKVAA